MTADECTKEIIRVAAHLWMCVPGNADLREYVVHIIDGMKAHRCTVIGGKTRCTQATEKFMQKNYGVPKGEKRQKFPRDNALVVVRVDTKKKLKLGKTVLLSLDSYPVDILMDVKRCERDGDSYIVKLQGDISDPDTYVQRKKK